MLKALLRGKLGRPNVDAETPDEDAGGSSFEYLTSREDPLTSAIFERFSYLDPDHAWRLLVEACRPSGLPEDPPAGGPRVLFWPRLSPGERGANSVRVEPDVLIEWGEIVLIIEAKHRAGQHAAQWVEQVGAVRAAGLLEGNRWFVIAASDTERDEFNQLARKAADTGIERDRFILLRWTALREALERSRPHLHGAQAAIAMDMLAALEAWGYRHWLGFDSLPSLPFRSITTTPATMKAWRLK